MCFVELDMDLITQRDNEFFLCKVITTNECNGCNGLGVTTLSHKSQECSYLEFVNTAIIPVFKVRQPSHLV